MSIAGHLTRGGLAAVAAATTLPAVAPPTVVPVSPAEPAWLAPVIVAWAAVGLVAASGLGAFRRRGIVGPERLAPDESAWGPLAVLAGGFLALIVGTVVANGLVMAGLRLAHRRAAADVLQLVVGGAGEAVAVAVVLALVGEYGVGRTGLRRLGLTRRGVPTALAGGTAALFVLYPLIELAGSGVHAVYELLHLKQAAPHAVLQMMQRDRRPAMAVVAVLTASVVAPVAEELAFRGLLQTALGRAFNRLADRAGLAPAAGGEQPPPVRPAVVARGVRSVRPTLVTSGLSSDGPGVDEVVPLAYWTPPRTAHTRPAARWAAVVVTSVAFAAVHVEPAFLAPIFVLSLGLGFVYERSGNLWMNIVTHSLFNTAQIIFFLRSGG